ncbi:MAG: LysM peptidoglycan-binding domain-containing protein [Anaerolineaceae bacterium]|nr:LysM peptidoglycan-binding domain-containing protein [Anaerolineaceae bacterium]
MAKKKSSSLLSSYRKKRQSGRTFVFILMGLLILAGLVLVGLWGFGKLGGGAWPIFATKTPTPTATATATPVTPTEIPSRTPTATETPTITTTPTPSEPFDYVIPPDFTSCYDIVEKFKTTLQLFYQVNNMTDCIVRIGQTVKIPPPGMPMPTETPLPTDIRPGTVIEIRAEPGASLKTIADYYLSTIDRIIAETNKYLLNQGLPTITADTALKVDQILKVPVHLVTPVPTATPTRTSTPTP